MNSPTSIDEIVPSYLDSAFRHTSLQNLQLLSDLCGQTAVSKVAFFVGAGISAYAPANMPLAKNILDELFAYCVEFVPDLRDAVNIAAEGVQQGEFITFEGIFQHLSEIVRPHRFYSPQIFALPRIPRRYNVNHEFLARWLHLQRGTVVTTNFDQLIEYAWDDIFGSTSSDLLVAKRPTDFDQWYQELDTRPVLWKLHGSADDPESTAIRLTSAAIKLLDGRADLLEYLISNHDVCFVGWQAADLDIFPCVREILLKQPSNTKRRIFWILNPRRSATTLADYLELKRNIKLLFEDKLDQMFPICASAEMVFYWLMYTGFSITKPLPKDTTADENNYLYLKLDLHTLHEVGIKKLIGFILRSLNKHDLSLSIFDAAANYSILSATGPLQEAALTYVEQGEIAEARAYIEKAWKLFQMVDYPIGKAWCEFGRVSLTLMSGSKASPIEKTSAVIRLFALQKTFERLLAAGVLPESSRHGVNLCLFYKTKLINQIADAFGFVRLRRVRQFLLTRYRATELPNEPSSIRFYVDIMRSIALLQVYDNPIDALHEIREAMKLAKAVGVRHYADVLKDATRLASYVDDHELIELAAKERQRLERL